MLKHTFSSYMMSGACAIALAFGGIGLANAQSANPQLVTLGQAVAVGVHTNPEYEAVASNRRATDEELNQAQALYLPSLDFQANGGVEYTDSPTTRATLADGDDDETLGTVEAGLTLTQMLFDGFDTRYENKRQEQRIASAAHRVREVVEFKGLDIVEVYLDVIRQRELLGIARDNVAEHMGILDQISDAVNVGRGTAADSEQARARLAAARALEADAKEALRRAEARYQRQIGEMPKDLEMPMIPVSALAPSVDEEVKVALGQSPTLAIFESDVNVAYTELKKSEATYYPEVDLQLNTRQGHNLSGVEGRNRSASALAVMNWNLYRGGADVARGREHVHRWEEAKQNRANAGRGVENDIRETWAEMVAAGERAREFSDQAAANAEVVKAYKDQFSLDRRTLLDVLDSQNELFVSRSNTVNARFVEVVAVYRLLAIRGELLNVLSVPLPRESVPAIL